MLGCPGCGSPITNAHEAGCGWLKRNPPPLLSAARNLIDALEGDDHELSLRRLEALEASVLALESGEGQ